MKDSNLIKIKPSVFCNYNLILKTFLSILLFSLIMQFTSVSAQAVLFDFDNATAQRALPLSLTVGGITAYFNGGYSIQAAGTMGFTPVGFAGNCIYPDAVFLSDLLINFDQKITDFSIMYAPQELACDDHSTLRVTAFMKGSLVGTNTSTGIFGLTGTWPTDTLSCSFPLGFDSLVVHYDKRPPTCQDYGVIFLADNMWVTALTTSVVNQKSIIEELLIPNPVTQSSDISFALLQPENINIALYDFTGRLIKNLFNAHLNSDKHHINLNLNDDDVKAGVYYLNLKGNSFSSSAKLVVLK